MRPDERTGPGASRHGQDEWVERGGFYTPEQEPHDEPGGPYRGRGPRGWRRDDETILEEVCRGLTDHGWLDARGVEVHVEGGEVTLVGTVEDRRQKRLAEDIADRVAGVLDVHNRLRLRAHSGATRAAPTR